MVLVRVYLSAAPGVRHLVTPEVVGGVEFEVTGGRLAVGVLAGDLVPSGGGPPAVLYARREGTYRGLPWWVVARGGLPHCWCGARLPSHAGPCPADARHDHRAEYLRRLSAGERPPPCCGVDACPEARA